MRRTLSDDVFETKCLLIKQKWAGGLRHWSSSETSFSTSSRFLPAMSSRVIIIVKSLFSHFHLSRSSVRSIPVLMLRCCFRLCWPGNLFLNDRIFVLFTVSSSYGTLPLTSTLLSFFVYSRCCHRRLHLMKILAVL